MFEPEYRQLAAWLATLGTGDLAWWYNSNTDEYIRVRFDGDGRHDSGRMRFVAMDDRPDSGRYLYPDDVEAGRALWVSRRSGDLNGDGYVVPINDPAAARWLASPEQRAEREPNRAAAVALWLEAANAFVAAGVWWKAERAIRSAIRRSGLDESVVSSVQITWSPRD